MVVSENHVPYTEHVGIRFTQEDMKELKKIARGKRVPVAILIRMEMADFIKREVENTDKAD